MFRPLNDCVIVEPVKAESNVGGVILTETATENYQGLRGVVVAVGPGHWTISGTRLPIELSVGDVVMLRPGGQLIREGGKLFYVVTEREVLAVVEGGPAVRSLDRAEGVIGNVPVRAGR
jgi:chaperonin GroES